MCKWQKIDDDLYLIECCGKEICVDGTPEETGMRFCMYCSEEIE